MGRPRKAPLPRGIYQRELADGTPVYSISFQFDGRQVQERVGSSLEEARRTKAERERQVAAGTYVPGLRSARYTVATYAPKYLAVVRAERRRSIDDIEQRLRDYVLPELGKFALADLQPRDVAAWVMKLRANPAHSPKTVHNIHGVLSAMLSLAHFERLIESNPAHGLRDGTLPKVHKRQVPPWSRAELEALISDVRIPWDRRVAYAIVGFTGARLGECAGLRLRDLDRKARPLWMWRLETQYDGQPLKGDDGGNPRCIPIHPELQAILEEWLRDGWVQFVARHPTPADFVVPREDGSVHSKESLGAKAVGRHASVIGIDRGDRDFHSFRRAFITLARTDGADKSVLERITHNANGEMIDGYTLYGWDTLCEAVSKLRLAPFRAAQVLSLQRAVGDSEHDRSHDRTAEQRTFTAKNRWRRRESKPEPKRDAAAISAIPATGRESMAKHDAGIAACRSRITGYITGRSCPGWVDRCEPR
jgi:integrase